MRIQNLESLGWSSHFEASFAPHAAAGLTPGRVVQESNEIYRIQTLAGELPAQLTGRLRYEAAGREDLPAVGDWVAAAVLPDKNAVHADSQAILHAVLPRASSLVRRAAGRRTEAQVVAANVDTAFLVTSLNQDLNLRRLERAVTLARHGGVGPVVLLSKADLAAEPQQEAARVSQALDGLPTLAVSCLDPASLRPLEEYLGAGRTVAVIGTSGVGKSTLINHLLGRDLLAIGAIREGDDRGRHTTTRRQLLALPGGALVVDTPGMRELGLWGGDGSGFEAGFDDVARLAAGCRYGNCRHESEPGCAVLAAVAAGTLDAERLKHHHRLLREQEHLELRLEGGAALARQKRRTARLHKAVKEFKKRYR